MKCNASGLRAECSFLIKDAELIQHIACVLARLKLSWQDSLWGSAFHQSVLVSAWPVSIDNHGNHVGEPAGLFAFYWWTIDVAARVLTSMSLADFTPHWNCFVPYVLQGQRRCRWNQHVFFIGHPNINIWLCCTHSAESRFNSSCQSLSTK